MISVSLGSFLVFNRYSPSELKKALLSEIKRQRFPALTQAELKTVASHVQSIKESIEKRKRNITSEWRPPSLDRAQRYLKKLHQMPVNYWADIWPDPITLSGIFMAAAS